MSMKFDLLVKEHEGTVVIYKAVINETKLEKIKKIAEAKLWEEGEMKNE